ncbi:MAG: S1C family serine protease [Acidimicrobiia bacterium]
MSARLRQFAAGLAVVAASAAATACTGDDGAAPAATTRPSGTAGGAVSSSPDVTPDGGSNGTSTSALPLVETYADVPELVQQVNPSVVAVITEVGLGSGVVWDDEGRIVTNHHVVAGAATVEVAFADGQRVAAEVVATDPVVDLAVLATDRPRTPAATFADELPEVGSFALAMGNPLGFENSVTEGIVSGLHRQIPGSAAVAPSLVDLIQTDAAISPGNSGGALVGPDGRIIGINVAYLPPQGGAVALGFAVPATTVTRVIPQLIDTGRAEHAFLGVQPGPITPQVAQRFGLPSDDGVLVLDAEPSQPAAEAGIRPGDVIVAFDGTDLRTVEDLLAEIARSRPGDTVTLEVLRGTERVELDATLSDRPS